MEEGVKWVFAILVLFFISFAFNSQSRELTFKERATLTPLAKTMRVKNYMLEHIDRSGLSFEDFLSFQILRNACVPLDSLQARLARESDDFPDQSGELLKGYAVCAEGVLGLTDIYLRTRHSRDDGLNSF